MIQQIRNSKVSKVIATYLALMIFVESTQPMMIFAMTSGPTQPEFAGFTPISTSDMVDLSSGDFNYNIPIMDVGGYPLNLAYNSGVTMDQEASWTGLGWNLNVGQIERQVRGLPDDFNGDKLTYENNLKENRTVGVNIGVNGAFTGMDALSMGLGLGIESNNYEGISFKPSFGLGFQFNNGVSVGMDLASSLDGGASVTPRVGISAKVGSNMGVDTKIGGSLSLGMNSRKGIENLNLSGSVSQSAKHFFYKNNDGAIKYKKEGSGGGSGLSGSVSFNNLSFTPSKRIGFRNENFSFNGALGGAAFGVEGQVQLTGYGSYQNIADQYRNREEKGYGYEFTEHKKSEGGVLDFNRENEKTISENTLCLPVTNYTYDMYSIDGQGVSGMFRPYRSKVSSVYNDVVEDYGSSDSFGLEVGLGWLFHGSGDYKTAPSYTSTGGWFNNNNVLNTFNEKNTDAKSVFYEPTTLKMVGGLVVDPETIYNNKIFGTQPLMIDIDGNKKNTYTKPFNVGGGSYGGSEIKRSSRFLRNQVIEKITHEEAANSKFIVRNENAKSHHTSAIKVIKTDGSTYVYGNSVYSTKKVEATFDVSGSNGINEGNNFTGEVGYNGSLYGNGSNVSDEYVNKITTPSYAHSYLLSSILSSDYEDTNNDGPTMNDLGSFTRFDYDKVPLKYNWRVPFGANKATYNEGLISKPDDQKGNYLYGEKELKYLNRIVTKTHVAFFDVEDRKDAIGVQGENGGAGAGRMKKLTSIRLYSRPEVTATDGSIVDPILNTNIKPIKTAHFIYNYNLCKGMPNIDAVTSQTANETGKEGGKLTLEKVYFTYRDSNMGRYTPYVFTYNAMNPNYHQKGFDVWGNYKAVVAGAGYINTALSNTEFPFVEQNKVITDSNTSAWTLKSIKLPSGGTITVNTESDDYQYVQNRKAMQMFKVLGMGSTNIPSANTSIYNGISHNRFLYVKLSSANITTGSNPTKDKNSFLNKYLKENLDKPINFRFLVNMNDNAARYDYVSGYLKIGNANEISVNYVSSLGGTIASIPVQMVGRDDSTNDVNPIAKAGWGLGRTYMNRLVYGINDNPTETSFSSIVENLAGSIGSILEIFRGPNGQLQSKGCARIFKPEKSWIRLENPDGHKLGGGLRVKSLKLSDNWHNMLEGTNTAGTQLNDMEYGQEYSYNDEQGNSSGVATFEPNMCAENPFVEPFYNNQGNYAESIVAPIENNYTEKPFGVNFFPAARITYSRVRVNNLSKSGVLKHATGSIVTQHYTTYDFPTKVRNTDLKMINGITPTNVIADMLANIILGGNIDVRNLLTLSQGYSIETNDMNGKIKLEKVYNESGNEMSSVEYKYNTDQNNDIDNNILTIDPTGKSEKRIIGVDYDVINDFNRSYAQTNTSGFKANLAGFLIPIGFIPVPIFIPTVFPESSTNVNEMRTAVTTKHVHKTAILVEKIATDLGATVTTKNIAWDANSGEVVLTKTQNEYSDSYFSLNYPAYWTYDGMGLASQNLGIKGTLEATTTGSAAPSSANASSDPYFKLKNYSGPIDKVFHVGDELYIPNEDGIAVDAINIYDPTSFNKVNTVWVVGIKDNKVLLMDRAGNYINKCNNLNTFPFKIVRSGFRNQQVASMASVTSMINPIDIDGNGTSNNLTQDSFKYSGTGSNPRIINASSVKYSDFWRPQVEASLPYYPEYNPLLATTTYDPNTIKVNGDVKYPYDVRVNPFVWNIKGDFRPEKSYAYLTGRNNNDGNINNPRNEGFFKDFEPFYQFLSSNCVVVPTIPAQWTYASSVTKISPYGAELENIDALNRSSAAQYGYQYKLPMAVASNSTYQQMGFEGFEEIKTSLANKHFAFYLNANSITSEQSHTGKNSIKIAKGTRSLIYKNLKPTNNQITKANCPNFVFTWTGWNPDFSCAGAPVLGGFFGDPNTFYPPFSIGCGEYWGCCPYSFSNVSYCLQNATNGGGATLIGGGIKINPANGNQIMYVTMTLTNPVNIYIPGVSSTNLYLKVTYESDGTWTYESVPYSSLFDCPPPPCADCVATIYQGPITIAAYTDCNGVYHDNIYLEGTPGGTDNPSQTIYTCGPHNNGGDGGDGGDGGTGGCTGDFICTSWSEGEECGAKSLCCVGGYYDTCRPGIKIITKDTTFVNKKGIFVKLKAGTRVKKGK